MKILVDTAPVVAAIHSGDSAHEIAKVAMSKLRRNAVLPSPVLVGRITSYGSESDLQRRGHSNGRLPPVSMKSPT